jgi:hypothetical protein
MDERGDEMKETIEVWLRIDGCRHVLYFDKDNAEKSAKEVGGTVVRLTGELPREPNVEDDFVKVTVDGVDYFESKKELPHQEALDLATKHGLRVLERWELCKLFDENEAFRKSLEHKVYWSASVLSLDRYSAWRFSGFDGYVSYYSRVNSYGVRCVGGG